MWSGDRAEVSFRLGGEEEVVVRLGDGMGVLVIGREESARVRRRMGIGRGARRNFGSSAVRTREEERTEWTVGGKRIAGREGRN